MKELSKRCHDVFKCDSCVFVFGEKSIHGSIRRDKMTRQTFLVSNTLISVSGQTMVPGQALI